MVCVDRVTGWRPRRTLMLAHWDAGEMSLAGVTEWIEVNRYLSSPLSHTSRDYYSTVDNVLRG